MRDRPSGAGVEADKVQAVLKYLQREFPNNELNHVPKPHQIADMFEVLGRREVLHRLLVHRRFFDRHDATALINTLGVQAAADKMRRAGTIIVDLG